MKWLLAFSIAAATAHGQNALWIDLSGPWRMTTDDRPGFAGPGFDDRQWQTLVLPSSAARPPGHLWLRRTVLLPEGTDRAQLALTLGTISDAYGVFVNGVKIGATGGLSRWDFQIPRPLTFPIPSNAAGANGNSLIVAIHGRNWGLAGPQSLRFQSAGPFRMTYLPHAPSALGTTYIQTRKLRRTPEVIFGMLMVGLGALLFLAWLGERKRSDLLWFALAVALEGGLYLSRYFFLAEDAYPQRWLFLIAGCSGLGMASFTYFAATTLDYRQRWLKVAIWLIWSWYPLTSLLTGEFAAPVFVNVFRTLCLLTIVMAGAAWWRQGTWHQPLGQQFFILTLLATACIRLNRFSPLVETDLDIGIFHYESETVALFLVVIPMAWQILRRVKEDGLERQRLAGELQAARVVQQFFLSQTPALGSGPSPIEAVYEPALEVGGDFYQLFALEDGSHLIAVGDVSGKGLRAAMVVSLITGALRNRREDGPAALLGELNRALAGSLDTGFVTATIAHCHPDGRVVLANAGNPAPYLAGVELTLDAGLPLGLAPGVEYTEQEITIGPGQQLTFVSDGVVEAENARRELFGFERTRSVSAKSAQEIAEAAKAWGQTDDITVVTVRRTA